MKLSQHWFFLSAAFGLALSSMIEASLTVRVFNGSSVVTVVDNGFEDIDPTIGSVQYFVPPGTFPGWGVVVVYGFGKPLIGSATAPELQLSWQASRSGAGSSNLSFLVSDNGFNFVQPTNLLAYSAGVLGTNSSNTVVTRSYYAANNVELNTVNLLTTHLFNGPGSFQTTSSRAIPADPTTSLTLRLDLDLVIGHFGAGEFRLFPNPPPPPPVVSKIFDLKKLTNSAFRFSFTNILGNNYVVLASTNVATPLSNWTVLGNAFQMANGLFQYTDFAATNNAQRFFKVRSP